MNSSTPLTRCNTCQTVFEVPQSILDSSDSRVRCGECLQVFDAGRNLHQVEKQDLSLLAVAGEYEEPAVDETQEPQEADKSSKQGPADAATKPLSVSENSAASTDQRDNAADKTDQAAVEQDEVAAEEKASPSPQQQEPEAQLENTHTDFDLFGRETELPEVSFEDSTMDAIRLDFDLVDDVDDETLSDTLFANDVTIDAAAHAVRFESATDALPAGENATAANSANQQKATVGVGGTAAEQVPKNKAEAALHAEKTLAAVARNANTDFQLDEGTAPAPLEFDYRAQDASQPKTQAAAPEVAVPATLEADALEQQTSNAKVKAGVSPDHVQIVQPIPSSPRSSVSRWRWISRGFMVVLVLAIIAALYTWRNRGQLADNGITRPGYQLWCLFSECEVPARLDTSKLVVVSKKIFSHPNLDDALVITIVIKNNAKFEQRYPTLFLWLSDRMRRTVASSEFVAEVYLKENDLAVGSTLAPGQQQRISIDVLDPGDEAVSLELDFR